MAGQISARNGGGSGALSRAGERTRTTGVDCKDVICRRYLGKYSIVDIFDTNTYAHDPRHDFLNWSIIDQGAFDYAANSAS